LASIVGMGSRLLRPIARRAMLARLSLRASALPLIEPGGIHADDELSHKT
jgi:hypothetical protein